MQEENSGKSPHIGKICVVRTYASGVHVGTLASQLGRQVELHDVRRIWRFDVSGKGISLSELALYGNTGGRARVCSTIPEMTILDALEIIPASAEAVSNIFSAEVAK